MNVRSELWTGRCKSRGGCGRWLIKYDPATRKIVKRNRRVSVRDVWPAEAYADSSDLYEVIWWDDPTQRSLVERGVMIEPSYRPPRVPPSHRSVECPCGKRYRIPPSDPR